MCRLFANASTLFSSPCILPHFHKIDVYFRLIFYVLKKIHYAVYVSSLIVFDKNAQINTNVDILTLNCVFIKIKHLHNSVAVIFELKNHLSLNYFGIYSFNSEFVGSVLD